MVKERHIHVKNHARVNNLAFFYFNYHLNIMILSKWISIQNQNSKIKFHKKLVIDIYKP